MKILTLLSLFVVSFHSFAIEFTIERRVKNGFEMTSETTRTGRQLREGVRTARPLYISEHTERYLRSQLNKIKQKLPIDFNKIRALRIVPTIFTDSNGDHPTTGRYYARTNTIEINHRYLFRGFEENLLKVLVHEISHAYEEEVSPVSEMEEFLYLAGWHRKGVVFKWKTRRNFMNQRSPDPYEYTNTSEAFAVNMERFLLDPKFQCRRPLLNKYLSNELLVIPFWDEDGTACEKMLSFPVQMGDKVGWWQMNPRKLYEVHYLLADKGNAAMSLFGHSMLRLVMCAPHRTEVSAECLKDTEHHMVLSYRANITDTYINSWKGLVGGYNSQLFVYPMISIEKEYTRDEFRNLISVPLNLRRFELQDFISKMQEEVWSYRGRYQFITQNCATETLDFFKAFIDRMAFRSQFSLRPNGVLDILHNFDLTYRPAIDSEDTEWKVQKTYLFKSKRPAYLRFFELINEYTHWDSLEDFLKKSTASERKEMIDRLEQNNVTSNVYSGMRQLEKFINILRQRSLQGEIIKFAETSAGAEELRNIIGNRLDFLRNQFPAENLGYGIPTPAEFEKIKEYINLKNNITGIDPQRIAAIVNEAFASQVEETRLGAVNERRLTGLTLTARD